MSQLVFDRSQLVLKLVINMSLFILNLSMKQRGMIYKPPSKQPMRTMASFPAFLVANGMSVGLVGF